jgi:molybdopterin/thiamine biosynthesis adenylyltransferase/rhodanese-related sulfurtransferase
MINPADQNPEIPVTEAHKSACAQQPLIDIREPHERAAGVPPGARSMSVEELLRFCKNRDSGEAPAGLVICAEGVRSLDAVQQLREAGFEGFLSVAGGFQAWLAAGLPVVSPDHLQPDQLERYSRHLVMPQVGPGGQQKLLDSRILLAGLGGLNSPVALYFAAAGVGTIGLVDNDRVERSNLQRQILHGEAFLGRDKTESARSRLADLNPDVETVVVKERIDASNADRIVDGWDIVVDGTDNFPVRYALNDACMRRSLPLVYGAVMRFQGQVSVFWPAAGTNRPCLRCLVPEEPAAGDAPSCADAGVLGVLPGIVGALQASEALKLALGIGDPLLGRLLLFDALSADFREMSIPRNPNCPSCAAVGKVPT